MKANQTLGDIVAHGIQKFHKDYTELQDLNAVIELPTLNSYICDALKEAGVILPPCKIGDKLYRTVFGDIQECEVVGFTKHGSSFFIELEYYVGQLNYESTMFTSELGKTAFFTLEEAEKAFNLK